MNTPMKDSGIPWIGLIPEHWGTRRIKFLFKERSEKGFPDEPVLCATQKYGVIPQSIYENRVVAVNKGLEGLKLVKEGDFVISLRSFQGGIEYAHYQGIISAAYTVLIPSEEVNPNYIKHLFKSHSFIELLQTCVTGIREGQNINYDLLRTNNIPLPPLSEQEAIANFLDEKCREVDTMVDIQVQFIEQLKAYKQSLIAETVTHGLNPTAPRKDSHIDWIGQIPQHWEVCRGKFIFSVLSGAPFDSQRFTNNYNDTPLIRIRDIQNETTEAFYSGEYDDTYLVQRGSILIGMDGDFNVALWNGEPALLNQRVCKIQDLSDKVAQKYIFYCLPIVLKRKNELTYATTVKHLSTFDIMGFSYPLPPLLEQQAMVDFLDKKCAQIDELIATKQQKINALHEYKKSIIYEYVTGKRNING